MAAFVSGHADTVGDKFAGTSTYSYGFGGNSISSGEFVVLSMGSTTRNINSIAGTNLTLTQLGTHSINGAGMRESTWYGFATGTCTSVTVTASGNTNDDAAASYASFSGMASDQSAATSGASTGDNVTVHDVAAVTPGTASNVMVCGGFRTNATWTDDTDFTAVSSANAMKMIAYRIQTSATAQAFSQSSDINRYSTTRLAAFTANAAGRSTKNTRSAPLGVNLGMGWRM